MSLKGSVAIVGAAETDQVGVVPELSALHLHIQAARNAIRDAGIDKNEIDGILTAGQSPVAIADYLDIVPSYVDGTSVGGCSFMIHVEHAAAAIQASIANVCLITHGESGRSRVGAAGAGGGAATWPGQFEAPFGTWGPPSMFSVPIVRHMKQYGTTLEHLAAVSVATREWATKNPRAMMRDPITIEDVLNSRLIAWPLTLLMCCLVTDGGGALIVASAERARQFPKRPVYLLGSGESCEHTMVSQMRDMTSSAAYRKAGGNAFRMAGVEHKDIDHIMFYDAFSHTPIYALEDLGFVDKGEGGPWFAEMRSAPGGELPINTNGGGLSYTHTGMYGMFAIQESVRQLRGEAAAELDDLRISLVHGPGGMFSASGTLILSNEAP